MKTLTLKILSLLLLAAIAGLAQSPAPVPPGSIVATISPQGIDPIKITTGYTPKAASLARVDICNQDATSDHNVATARAAAAIILFEKNKNSLNSFGIYDSEVVHQVLIALQEKSVFNRVSKIIKASSDTMVAASAILKVLSPWGATIAAAAPGIATAILPAVASPADIAALAAQIVPDNTVYALGRAGSGNDCKTGLVVVMSPTVAIDSVIVQ
jgi:hypothetical protein